MSEAFKEAQDRWCENLISDADLCDAVAVVGPECQRVPFIRAHLATISKPLKAALYGDWLLLPIMFSKLFQCVFPHTVESPLRCFFLQESSHEHGFKPLVRWISRRTNTWTRFERCDRWRLWCHHPQRIPFGAELDASEGITCTQSCQVVDDRWSGEILLALLAALGPRFGLHTDIADYDRISEAFLGFAGGSPAHILE